MAASHSYLLENVATNIPTLFVCLEDLERDPAAILNDVFKFVFGISDITGTVLEKRIQEVSYFSKRMD